MVVANKKIHHTILILLVGFIPLLIPGCTFIRHSIAALRSTDHFIPHQSDSRVLYEPNAKVEADKIVSFLNSAIQQIEYEQYRPFAETAKVYICDSKESFYKMFGANVKAGVLWNLKLFLSPRIFDKEDGIIKYLTHELSHLHLLQQLGLYRLSRLPFWFNEGLATYVSGGGGAQLVSEKEAIESIKKRKHFIPNETGGLIFRKTPSDFDLKPHMFYRQSMLFIRYLVSINESKFRKFLLSIENGESLLMAFRQSYNKNLEELWRDFLLNINEMG